MISPQIETKIKVGQHVLARIKDAQYEAYFVGGFVRDFILKRFETLDDIDITTNMPMELIERKFVLLYEAKQFGMLCITFEGHTFEVTQFRTDGTYTDNRRPDTIQFATTLFEDVQRRDFTINGLAMDSTMQVYDYVNGIADLESQLIRTIGNPTLRFQEDSLRMIRALRFSSNLDFTIEEQTANALRENRFRLSHIPLARIRLECEKVVNFQQFLGYIRQFELYHYHAGFKHVVNIDQKYDSVITSWEVLSFFQIYSSANKQAVYTALEIGKQHRHYYEKIVQEIELFQKEGQSSWWHYQLNGDVSVFKFLALMNETPYNKYEEMYATEAIKTWRDIQFDIRLLQDVPNYLLQNVKQTIAYDVIHKRVQNNQNKIQAHIEEVYGWK